MIYILIPRQHLYILILNSFLSYLQVLPSDTLNNISLRYNVSVAELKKVNNIWSDQDFYGLKRIKVPAFGGGPVLNQPSAPSMDVDID